MGEHRKESQNRNELILNQRVLFALSTYVRGTAIGDPNHIKWH